MLRCQRSDFFLFLYQFYFNLLSFGRVLCLIVFFEVRIGVGVRVRVEAIVMSVRAERELSIRIRYLLFLNLLL